jgi:hypothetical protein
MCARLPSRCLSRRETGGCRRPRPRRRPHVAAMVAATTSMASVTSQLQIQVVVRAGTARFRGANATLTTGTVLVCANIT